MSAKGLLAEIRSLGVELQADGKRLHYRPKAAVTAEPLDRLKAQKPQIMKLLEQEHRRLEEADRRGLVIKWARERGWITLHDPTTGEWHEVKASECLPGVIEAANTSRRGQPRRRGQETKAKEV